ncbi:MAG TPA: RimK family protein [Polyangiaceae bacterium]|jgi:glutathione synthase/RimK-type ligase-like ATP-grasp enzyme|nr:RimK family protein [Polyangiaceae bacterium]
MRPLVVVSRALGWPLKLPGVEIVAARDYLSNHAFHEVRGVKVFNLCRSYRYQSIGYYVSLLATARGHRPAPSVATIQDLKAAEIVRIRSEGLENLIARSFRPLKSDRFVLSIYFGRNLARRYDRLSAQLFKLFDCPFLRATFSRSARNGWQLNSITPIAAEDIPERHRDFVIEAAGDYFRRRRWRQPKFEPPRYDLAILYDSDDPEPPSDKAAIRRFVRAAHKLGMGAYLIDKEDYAHVAEYDALFIRETTNVHHYTYRFARRAHSEGMVVVDDPDSILRCTNKVYLAELLARHDVPTPQTLVVHRGNVDRVGSELGFPCVLKQPDSAFSLGVKRVASQDELELEAERMFSSSELLVAQEYTPTAYDWRVGLFDGRPLWACRYHMAAGHWQIAKLSRGGARNYGKVEAVRLDDVPRAILRTAVNAARLIGRGLYGVDLKLLGRSGYVIEVNDNPTIEAGEEDAVLGDELYTRIMGVFRDRLDQRLRTVA